MLLIAEPEGGFTVKVPALDGCITFGKTLEEARHNAKEAIELYIESLNKDGLEIPSDDHTYEINLQVESA